MMCGSCFGAVSWAARMMSQVNGFRGNDLLSTDNDEVYPQAFSYIALSLSWSAARQVTFASEFLLLSAAQLMVLDRMSVFVTLQGHGARKWWAAGGRAVMAAVVLCNAVGLAANIAAAIYAQKAADTFSTASILYASNNTRNDAIKYIASGRSENQFAYSISSVQSFCEVAVLLLIVLVFAMVGVTCIRRLSSALTIIGTPMLDAAGSDTYAAQHHIQQGAVDKALALGRRLRQEVVVTTSFVFVAFLLRSAVSTLTAVANQSQDSAKRCSGVTDPCDALCNNVFTRIGTWNAYTPEFVTTVVLISSPLTLLAALRGMTCKLTLQLMRSSRRQRAAS